jgi:hypothetical protein
MSFDWMEPKRNAAFTKTLPAKRAAMYRAELEERAALLHRLGHSKASVKARLLANVGWDFEQAGGAPGGAETAEMLNAIVDREYGGVKAAPPPTKGEKG